jgi:hypothetical protein
VVRAKSNGGALWIALIGFALVVAFSVLVGFVGSHETSFDWELASIFGTALGTTLLALATAWLAYSTRSEVRATQELAQLTREDQAARDRPVVMVELWNHEPGKVGGRLTVQLRTGARSETGNFGSMANMRTGLPGACIR